MKIAVRLDDTLLYRARREAALRRTTLAAIIEEGLQPAPLVFAGAVLADAPARMGDARLRVDSQMRQR